MTYHMRRADRAITDQAAIERLLRDGTYTSIALVDGDEPYVVTLSYGYDAPRRRLYFHAAHEGRKLDVIAKNPRACATIIAENGYTTGECEHPFESLVLTGTMRLVTDDAEKLTAIHTLVEHLEPDAQAYWSSRSWTLESRVAGFSALCLDIDSVSAKTGK
jgi:uncharacterized protein